MGIPCVRLSPSWCNPPIALEDSDFVLFRFTPRSGDVDVSDFRVFCFFVGGAAPPVVSPTLPVLCVLKVTVVAV